MREYHSRENWYRRLPIRQKIALRLNQRVVANRWRRWVTRGALRGAAGVGSLAAVGLANYFTKVPDLSNQDMSSSYRRSGAFKRARAEIDQLRKDQIYTEFNRAKEAGILPKRLEFDSAMDVDQGRRIGGFNTYTKTRARGGKRMRLSRRRQMVLNAEVKPVIFRYTAATGYSGSSGYHTLRNTRNTTAGGYFTYPVHLYDLTAVINEGGAGVVASSVGHAVSVLDTGTTVGYQPLRGSAPNGTNYQVNYYVPEQDFADQSNLTTLGVKAFHCWSDIRLVLYGMLTTPTRFTLQIVMFSDEDYVPEINTAFIPTTPTTIGTVGVNTVANFWQDQAGPYIRNPILNNPNKRLPQVLRVLATKSYLVDPRSTVNSDTATPTTVELKWFYTHNRIRNYDWEDNSVRPANQGTRDDTFVKQDAGQVRPNVEQTKRVFLMIKAQSLSADLAAEPVDSTATVNTTQPSYDILIRNKYYTIT